MIAKVEPLTPARALRGPFDYRLGAGMEGVDVGSMLVVPFGRQRMLGVVVGMADRSDVPEDRLVEPLTALDPEVPPELIKLGLWVAEEYCSTPSRGLQLVLPPGTGRGARPRVRPRLALAVELTQAGREAILAGVGGSKQRAALEVLRTGARTAAAVCQEAECSHQTLRALEAKGLVRLERVELARRPDLVRVGARSPAGVELNAAQQATLAEITGRLREPTPEPLLLHGVTGSGKTEVYLQAVASAIEMGRSAIVLVPEIALTPQTASRFEQRFGELVAVLHSRLGAGPRYDEWVRLRRGEARVCVGPRSAVFAPVRDLGLIIVDEEHDPSYKQDGDPRYDARRVAERRAADCRALLLAGTATPRPESWRTMSRISLPERVDGRGLPPVEVVGMLGTHGALHATTREALDEVRERGEKAIVLLNRRGWSNFLSCRVCARVWECPECDVTLVLHRAAGVISCHHCGHEEGAPTNCPDCGSVSVTRHGFGTERLERELAELVAPLEVFRLDSDAVSGRGAIGELLRRFDRAESGVLLGTQMVAKGHDFPDVTLGVVLDADSTLRFPDFRAEERTFALVAQLAGRSGRGARGGKVIVQAIDPRARPLAYAARHDSEGFVEGELARREALGYPPFGHLIRIVCASAGAGPEVEAAQMVRSAIALDDASVLGPAPLFRLKGRERAQLVVKAPDRAGAVTAVRAAVERAAAEHSKRGVIFSVDVDPQ